MKPFFVTCLLVFEGEMPWLFCFLILDLLGQDRRSHYVLRPKSSATSSVKKLEKKKLPGAAWKCRIHSEVDLVDFIALIIVNAMVMPEGETSIMHRYMTWISVVHSIRLFMYTQYIEVEGVRVFARVRFIQCSVLFMSFPWAQWRHFESLGQEACGRSLSGRSLA